MRLGDLQRLANCLGTALLLEERWSTSVPEDIGGGYVNICEHSKDSRSDRMATAMLCRSLSLSAQLRGAGLDIVSW